MPTTDDMERRFLVLLTIVALAACSMLVQVLSLLVAH